ncbi:MAG: hypothetical protein JWP25_3694 [Bradyrhizobium sp.]|nr:hypothetical protein [Bradyrhizobium sp.]
MGNVAWVILDRIGLSAALPVFPNKQTCWVAVDMSQTWEKSSRSTAARLRLFDCRTSPARTTGIAVEKRAACRSLFSECAHGSPELRLT